MEEEKARITALHSDHIASLLAKALDEKEKDLADLARTHTLALEALQTAHTAQQQLLTEELGSKTVDQIAAMEQQWQAVADQRVEDLQIELKKELVTYLLSLSYPSPTTIINPPPCPSLSCINPIYVQSQFNPSHYPNPNPSVLSLSRLTKWP